MNRFTPRVARWTFGLSLIAGLGLAGFAPLMIRLLYSPAFSAAYGPLLWLLPGTLVFGIATVIAHDIAGRGYPQYNAFVAVLTLLLTVPLYLLLIPRWGAVGAAVASSISYGATTVLTLVVFRRLVRRDAAPATQPERHS
jgi:O-antigen/teichoic acid export membrane protein